MRKAHVLYGEIPAGELIETDEGYEFVYYKEYLVRENAEPVSLTLPLQNEPFRQPVMFSFFDGLIPEGWMLDIGVKNWKVNRRDRMGLLLAFCRDTIGAVCIEPAE
jgi:serine/threonine-protein kinase HipA